MFVNKKRIATYLAKSHFSNRTDLLKVDLLDLIAADQIELIEMDKKAERLAKLKKLSAKRVQSSQQNHREVVEEYKRMKLPSNFEKKREWAEVKIEKEKLKEQMQREGKDYERESFLDMQADEAERWEKKQRDKRGDGNEYTSYEDMTARLYTRQVKNIKPDLEGYEEKKKKLGAAFYPTKETDVTNLHKDSKERIDALVEDLNKQVEKRNKFSRRRKLDDSQDIDYINEKNRRFNNVLERFYGSYTAGIKQDLERGTAV